MRKTNLGGAGFNPQYADRLFTPFQRLHSSNDYEGTVSRSYILGANSFITKPVDFGEFTDLFTRMTGYWLDINQSAQQ